MNALDKPAVLITGASGGIGLAAALTLHKRGARVFAGVRSEAKARDLLDAHGSALTPVILDVTDEGSCVQAMERVTEALGGGSLSALVNNAGIAVQGPLETLPISELIAQFEVNLFGVTRMVQAALPSLRRSAEAGRRVTIVNLGSIGGRLPIPFNGPYNASKFALVGFDGALRQELRPWGIRVALVEPGTTRTDIWGKVEASINAAQGDGEAQYGEMLNAYRKSVQKLQRAGIPAERVGAVIANLIEARSPAHRTLVGDAKFLAIMTAVPTRLRDFMMGHGLGLPGFGAALRSK